MVLANTNYGPCPQAGAPFIPPPTALYPAHQGAPCTTCKAPREGSLGHVIGIQSVFSSQAKAWTALAWRRKKTMINKGDAIPDNWGEGAKIMNNFPFNSQVHSLFWIASQFAIFWKLFIRKVIEYRHHFSPQNVRQKIFDCVKLEIFSYLFPNVV